MAYRSVKGSEAVADLARRFPQLYVAPADDALDRYRLAAGRAHLGVRCVAPERGAAREHVQVEPGVPEKRELEPDLGELAARKAALEGLVCERGTVSEELLLAAAGGGEGVDQVIEHRAVEHMVTSCGCGRHVPDVI